MISGQWFYRKILIIGQKLHKVARKSMQNMGSIPNFTNLEEVHPRNIHIECEANPCSGFREKLKTDITTTVKRYCAPYVMCGKGLNSLPYSVRKPASFQWKNTHLHIKVKARTNTTKYQVHMCIKGFKDIERHVSGWSEGKMDGQRVILCTPSVKGWG